ncbi:MAG TPA: pilus assembly protein TadG-related protein [Acidimicrobiia bacterium]|nr:pilus assembly protein TadG-related protein [Acidimicrobiia bacterium]
MSRFLARRLLARSREEQGFVLVLFALLMVALLGVAAVVVDLGQQRSSRRSAQAIADLAALGGGKSLSAGDPGQACVDAITYLNMNVQDLSPKITASTFCTGQPGNNVTATSCTVTGGIAQAKPTTTVGRYAVTLMYPVLDSDMADSHFTGTGKRDGTACQRMGVKVGITSPAYFGRIFGTSTLQTSRTAIVKMTNSIGSRIPALWLLDPYGCTPLSISGGAQLTLGDASASPPIPGVATIDSDGTQCSQNQDTLMVGGSGSYINAVPLTGTNPGVISLYALPADATTCVGTACNPSDVNAGLVAPQPVPALQRATRSPIDWRYNCKRGPNVFSPIYPPYHGITLADCPPDVNLPPYIDQFTAIVGTSGQPVDSSFARWRATQNCNVPSGTFVVTGNAWVDCNTLNLGNGSNVVFNGNVVFDGTVAMTNGSSLTFNSGNASSALPSACQAAVTTSCAASSSQNAAFAYFRNGDLTNNGGTLTLRHTFMYQKGGAIKDTAGAAPTWSPPSEGPFAALSLWSEKSDVYTINGGGGLDLSGVFFTPEANAFKLTGGGGVNQQHAQFIAYHLELSGSGTLKLAPDNTQYIAIPPRAGTLIR